MISYDVNKRQFKLNNGKVTYIMELTEDDYLIQVHNGTSIEKFTREKIYPNNVRSSFNPTPASNQNGDFSLALVPQEFGTYDVGDYRTSTVEATYSDGTSATTMKYVSHKIIAGKPSPSGLPATYASADEAETLIITMIDESRNLKIDMLYTIFFNLSVICRRNIITNISEKAIVLNKAYSASFDFDDMNFDYLQLPGSWAAEKQLERVPLRKGVHILESKRGASGSYMHPFTALMRKDANEFQGSVWAYHFVYSGNFTIELEGDSFSQTRVSVGISPNHFNWHLLPFKSFQTPEVVQVFSENGLNDMSQTFHELYQKHLIRGKYQNIERPILINNWETTYFNFNEDKLLKLADKAKDIGVELFVLDDGWFGQRNDDCSSLGDWFVNKKKLPEGISGLAKKINSKGLQFGIWVEPEMISRESELYKKHPDWHIHVNNYPESLGRNQLMLDLSRKDVEDYLFKTLNKLFSENPISYVKWDYNRNMTEVGSSQISPERQGEVAHRSILGLYSLLERLIQKHPDILFENCSGGGGRFDPGMCYYMPQSWASDNTDAIARMKIQYANSLFFPISTICAQVSDVPNHQTGRITPFETRLNVASSANFGIMLHLENEDSEDLKKLTKHIEWYKKHRRLIQFGKFTRLLSPFDSNYCSWSFMDNNSENGILFFGRVLQNPDEQFLRVKLPMLNEAKFYKIGDLKGSGEEFKKYGIYLNTKVYGDFSSYIVEIKEIAPID